MRRVVVIFLVVFFVTSVFYTGFTSPVKAQDVDSSFDYQRAYQDYVHMGNTHRKAYEEYEVARNQYIKFGTLTSRAKAQEKTYEMLKTRDDLIRSYLTAIRMRLVQATGLVEDEKAVVYSELDPEVAWYIEHKNSYKSTDTLDELVRKSDEVKKHYEHTTVVIYHTLSLIPIGKMYDHHKKVSDIVVKLESKIAEIKEDEFEDGGIDERKLYLINSWLEETKQGLNLNLEKLSTAKSYFEPESKIKNGSEKYRKSMYEIEAGRKHLLEANSFLKEIIREIKTVR
jgi:hypothetical protein